MNSSSILIDISQICQILTRYMLMYFESDDSSTSECKHNTVNAFVLRSLFHSSVPTPQSSEILAGQTVGHRRVVKISWGKSPQVPKRMGRTDLTETKYIPKKDF